jgi:hypothetical protein
MAHATVTNIRPGSRVSHKGNTTIIRERAETKKHKGHRGSRRGESSEKVLAAHAMGGFILGYIDKTQPNIPTIPILGRAGTIAVAAHFIGKGKPGIATNVRNAAAAVAGYEFGNKGTISGTEGSL